LSCPFLAGSESESWETTFKKLVTEKKVHEAKALWVKIGIVFGDSSLNVMEHTSSLRCRDCKNLRFGQKKFRRQIFIPENFVQKLEANIHWTVIDRIFGLVAFRNS
jgi:hypothetical protein